MDNILLHDAGQIFDGEGKLIELPSYGKCVIVGDTHGDLDATNKVLGRYLSRKEYKLVFLGDYVDRGYHSKDNVNLLLRKKVDNPERLYLLMGNHEARKYVTCLPAEFWNSLSEDESQEYEDLFAKLPLAASGNGLLALHGAPPDLNPERLENKNTLQDISKIEPGSGQWLQITCGDLTEREGEEFFTRSDSLRKMYGSDYFARVMDDLYKEVLIRSHQPQAPLVMLNSRCLTIFTSHDYLHVRNVAIADLGKETVTVNDLRIEEV